MKLQVLLWPLASTAVQCTVVRPTGKLEPDGGTQVTTGVGSTLSVAVAVKVALASHWPGGAVTTRFVGHMRTGGTATTTDMRKVALLTPPKASTATQVTRVTPSGKVLPEGGRQMTGTFGWQVLVAVMLNVATVPDRPVASATRLVAPRRVGATMSGTREVDV